MTLRESFTHHSVRAHLVLPLLRRQRRAACATFGQQRGSQLREVLVAHQIRTGELRHRRGHVCEDYGGLRLRVVGGGIVTATPSAGSVLLLHWSYHRL